MRALSRRGCLPRYGEHGDVTIARQATSLWRDNQRRHSEAGSLIIATWAASIRRENTTPAGGLPTGHVKNKAVMRRTRIISLIIKHLKLCKT
ncbi:hypothetical protein [Prevotella heparinolytica]|uniref:hypothetical protein n=1 Tax=Prevotella heparinolytica TaxID=28113 RepID=UPI00101AD7E0|nr:hypothetical protein [Bacteroides heparinolyticus]